MGHLLSSVNPEAAERIENPTAEAPDVGTMVVYIARRGMMRMGRTEFPAIVLGHDTEGHLDLFVLMEPEDMMLEQHVRPQMSEFNEQGHCWREVEPLPSDDWEMLQVQGNKVAELDNDVSLLRMELAELKKLVLGDYKPAKLSVYDLLAEFEGKLAGSGK